MPYSLAPFGNTGLNEALLEHLIDEHETSALPEYDRLWSYYRNPSERMEIVDRGIRRTVWRPAQAAGLPTRLTRNLPNAASPREIVIENDIAWRIETLANYVANDRTRILSQASDPSRREFLEEIAEAIFLANGGQQLIQDLVLQGSIYGHVDLVVRASSLFDTRNQRQPIGAGERESLAHGAPSNPDLRRRMVDAAGLVQFEMIEAPRAIPLPDPNDWSRFLAYIIYFRRATNEVERPGFLQRAARKAGILSGIPHAERATSVVTEIISDAHRQVYDDAMLVIDEPNALGSLPVVHMQNLSQPYFYEGLSDVEPLIGLQDELNTRLSDRANRVTMQSFKMYLGKGIDHFDERPVGPGQMWMTHNADASIESFGGDAESPSEDRHIEDIRAAMDKASSVSPLAAGLIRTKVGTLSSENALRISLLGILAKTERKRQSYGRGLREAFRLAMDALDRAGVVRTQPEEREFEIVWESPLPQDETKQLENAVIKRDLGVPRDRILAELGYDDEVAASNASD